MRTSSQSPNACPLDVDVAIEQLELFLQRDLVRGTDVERFAQQLAERRDHAVGGGGILVHELGDGVERVEKKVRVQLHFEQLQPGAGEPRLEL